MAGKSSRFSRTLPASKRGWKPAGRASLAGDLNFNDTSIDSTVNSSSTPILLNGVVVGTSSGSRFGRQINVKSIHVQFQILPSSSTVRETARWLLVHDATPNGVLPTRADIWSPNAASNVDPLSFRNLDNRNRFTIIRTGTTTINGGSLVGNYERSEPENIYLKGDWKTIYNADNGSTIAAIQTGAIYFLVFNGSGAAATNLAVIGNVRTRFTP